MCITISNIEIEYYFKTILKNANPNSKKKIVNIIQIDYKPTKTQKCSTNKSYYCSA